MSGTLADHVAAQLRAEMGRQELTNEQLAARLGVSDMWVSRRKQQKTQISMADVERLAEALNVPVEYFYPTASGRVA